MTTMTMTTKTMTMTKAVLLAVAIVAVALALTARDDDRLVDPDRPDARRAIAAAVQVVPGRLVDVRRDSDNGKWEVTLHADGRDYEVELASPDLALLRIDYDTD
jgi:uncharacterized membrane protein YkoI